MAAQHTIDGQKFSGEAGELVNDAAERGQHLVDVFPIPSGVNAKDAKGNPIISSKTGQAVQVPGYFKMRSRFVDYAGYLVIHCHILAHEDRGMMTVVEVSPAPLPYSHN